MTEPIESVADRLNRDCQCAVTDLARLGSNLDDALEPAQSISATHPHLFAGIPVFLEYQHVAQMQRVVAAVEELVQVPSWQETVTATAPAIARTTPGNPGVFFGFDFHIGPAGPQLIEINTNAGGAFLNTAVRDVQLACCAPAAAYLARQPTGRELEQQIVAMFRREWALAGNVAPLQAIAIVDDNPAGQYLFPEFQLAKRLFESHGIRAHIVDTAALERDGEHVLANGDRIDLIYNRSTDFYLESEHSRVLRHVHENHLAVVTPHPRAHALYANKSNLALLSSADALARFGIKPESAAVLVQTTPPTREVEGCEETWWRSRKDWFFKPRGGFAGRGAYRGEKMTRRVFEEIMKGGYIAQRFTPASERRRVNEGGNDALKIDIRCYAYAGEIQLMAARLYQGQTTNFRTAGGGFAPLYVVNQET
jgi:hypothetical protein